MSAQVFSFRMHTNNSSSATEDFARPSTPRRTTQQQTQQKQPTGGLSQPRVGWFEEPNYQPTSKSGASPVEPLSASALRPGGLLLSNLSIPSSPMTPLANRSGYDGSTPMSARGHRQEILERSFGSPMSQLDPPTLHRGPGTPHRARGQSPSASLRRVNSSTPSRNSSFPEDTLAKAVRQTTMSPSSSRRTSTPVRTIDLGESPRRPQVGQRQPTTFDTSSGQSEMAAQRCLALAQSLDDGHSSSAYSRTNVSGSSVWSAGSAISSPNQSVQSPSFEHMRFFQSSSTDSQQTATSKNHKTNIIHTHQDPTTPRPQSNAAKFLDEARATLAALESTPKRYSSPQVNRRGMESTVRAKTPTRTSRLTAVSTSSTPENSRSLLRYIASSWNNKSAESSTQYKDGGYLSINAADVLDGRYEVIRKLGWGEFSTVWLCLDRKARSVGSALVAVKVSKCRADISRGAILECLLLTYLRDTKRSATPLTTLLNTFEQKGQYGNHFCVTMPVNGPNMLCLIDYFKAKRSKRRADKEVALLKDITIAVLRALDHLESINVLHTDLKPENVLCSMPDQRTVNAVSDYLDKRSVGSSAEAREQLVKSVASGGATADPTAGGVVSLADFGLSLLLEPGSSAEPTSPSSIPSDGGATGSKQANQIRSITSRKKLSVKTPGQLINETGMLIQTREYRAPEVLVGADFNCRTDIWSLGCMVYELITGDFLMDPKRKTRDERAMDVEHLCMIMEILGPVPSHISRPTSSSRAPKHHGRYFDANGRFLHTAKFPTGVPQRRSISQELAAYLEPQEAERAAQFIMSCFTYDPMERCHASDLLKHSWLRSNGSQ